MGTVVDSPTLEEASLMQDRIFGGLLPLALLWKATLEYPELDATPQCHPHRCFQQLY